MPIRPRTVILIVTDQQRGDSLGCCGDPIADTPNLDALAAGGTLCTRAISVSAICSPARASLLTGLLPATHGVWTNGVALPRRDQVAVAEAARATFPGKWIASHVDTIADRFAAAGWTTAAVGKLHLEPTLAHADLGLRESTAWWNADPSAAESWHGPLCGFQHLDLTIGHGEHVGGHFGAWLRREHPQVARAIAAPPLLEFPEEPQVYPSALPEEAHHSTWIGERAAARIRSTPSDRPLLLWVGFPDPHHPFTPPAGLAHRFAQLEPRAPDVPPDVIDRRPPAYANLRRKRGLCRPQAIRRIRQHTAAMVHLVDRAVGRIMGALREAGRDQDAIVVFTSDHGDFLGDYGLHGKDVPACRSLNHVPLIIRAPGAGLPARIPAAVSGADIAPTIAALAGLPCGVDDGIPASQGHVLTEASSRRVPVMVQHATPTPERANLSLWDDRWRLTLWPTLGACELYDHRDDPFELVDRGTDPAYRVIRADLEARLSAGLASTWLPRAGRVAPW
jgi:arylsulfatase A-like enzyme